MNPLFPEILAPGIRGFLEHDIQSVPGDKRLSREGSEGSNSVHSPVRKQIPSYTAVLNLAKRARVES